MCSLTIFCVQPMGVCMEQSIVVELCMWFYFWHAIS